MPSLDRTRTVFRSVVSKAREENLPFMAGSIAYQAFVSLVPLLVLLFFLVSFVGDRQLAMRVVEVTRTFLPAQATSLLATAIEGRAGSLGASIIGLVTLVWGSLRLFRGLDTAFSEIFGTSDRTTLAGQLKDGTVVLVAIGGGLVAAVLATTLFAVLAVPYASFLSPLALVVALSLAFYPMFRRFPDRELSRWTVLPGVVVSAAGWAALQTLFGVYISLTGRFGGGENVIGAVLLLLTWLYLGGFVILFGAVVSAVLAERHGAGAPE